MKNVYVKRAGMLKPLPGINPIEQDTNMKIKNYETARGPKIWRLGIKGIGASLVLAVSVAICSASAASRAVAEPKPPAVSASEIETAGPATNSPVASIAADLQRLKLKIENAVLVVSNAVESTPAAQAARVRKLADEISSLASKDLSDEGEILKRADGLIGKFKESVA